MTTYLVPTGSVYRFRRVVPEDLQPFFFTKSGAQRIEFNESLGTKDRREAERRCRLRAVEIDKLFEEARRRLTSPSTHKPYAFSQAEIEGMDAASAENRKAHFEWEDRAVARNELVALAARKEGKAALALRDLLADDLFEPPQVQMARERENAASWADGEREFEQAWSASRGIQLPSAYPDLMGLFDKYVSAAQIAPASVKRWRPVMSHLIAFAGHDDASKLTVKDVRDWRDALLAEEIDGVAARGAKTVREAHLAALKAVLSDAVQRGALAENVATGVKVRVPRKVRLRQPTFTSDEVNIILSATLREQPKQLSPKHKLARRWVPWICAYTGARVNEITQLRSEDIAKVDGVWAIRITPEAGTVKDGNARFVPIHEHLIEQGFASFAAAQGLGPLFYEPRLGRGGSDANPHFKKVGERLAAWVRSLGVTDVNVQPNHAWRHLWINMAEAAGLDPVAREAIPGHAPATEGRKYGGLKPIVFLSREIGKFPRFTIKP